MSSKQTRRMRRKSPILIRCNANCLKLLFGAFPRRFCANSLETHRIKDVFHCGQQRKKIIERAPCAACNGAGQLREIVALVVPVAVRRQNRSVTGNNPIRCVERPLLARHAAACMVVVEEARA